MQVENDNVLKISEEQKREDVVQDGEVKYVRVKQSTRKFALKFNLLANANLNAMFGSMLRQSLQSHCAQDSTSRHLLILGI